MANQEFHKTTFPTFGPFFAETILLHLTEVIQNIPEKWPIKNLTKRVTQLLDHLLHIFVDFKNYSIMVRMLRCPPIRIKA